MCGKEGGDGERGEVVELVRELLLRGMTADDSGVMIKLCRVRFLCRVVTWSLDATMKLHIGASEPPLPLPVRRFRSSCMQFHRRALWK